jgi:predicted nucleic acid-binding protein
MADRLLLDTNVLIDFFRKRPQAVQFMESLRSRPMLSVVTIAELFAGVRDGEERVEVELFLNRSIVIDLNEQIATRAGLLLRQFRKSHGVGLGDALISATAETEGARVVSLNAKHFPMCPDLLVPYNNT